MNTIEAFLNINEEKAVVEAIRKAELNTSGEIRVHIEQHCEKDVLEHTIEVFHNLKMHNTAQRNGVLLYVALNNKQFSIYGDKGINSIVGQNFWNSTKDIIQKEFKKGRFKHGLIKGIEEAGTVLSKHFPWDNTDINELENNISKG